MTEPRAGIVLKELTITGSAKPAELSMSSGLTVLFGASNTGKSFAVKLLDFMLGSSRPLPDVSQRASYDSAWLSLILPKAGPATVGRALAGGPLAYFEGIQSGVVASDLMRGRRLSARNDATSADNLSQVLLAEIGLDGREIAVDANGQKRGLSFRDLTRFCIVDETAIQSETSPALSGQNQLKTSERSIFRMLLTGSDDKAVIPVVDRKTFKASTSGKIEVIDELIVAVNDELDADFPHSDQLLAQAERIEMAWDRAQAAFELSQESVRSRLKGKHDLANEIGRTQERLSAIEINIGRFEQLQKVYQSDIQRLEAIEEAGFFLALADDQPCPLCGAIPEHQSHAHGSDEIASMRGAAEAEISKIHRQAKELEISLADLNNERLALSGRLRDADVALAVIEAEIQNLAPSANEARNRLQEVLTVRDHVRRGIELLQRRQALQERRDRLASAKPAGRSEKPQLSVPGGPAYEFAHVVSKVLTEWQFPGNRHVVFDEAAFDLKIDGKHRRDNGKGIRAITHAAFKVALLLFCRDRGLPHPGFLVLDTPLLTYRDPVASRAGPLSPDERALSNTTLKDFFFEHLAKEGVRSQFVVVENIDLPSRIDKLAQVETFTGDLSAGRSGLFHGG